MVVDPDGVDPNPDPTHEINPDLPSRKTRYRSYPKITTQIQDNNMHKYFFYDKLSYQSHYNCDIIIFLKSGSDPTKAPGSGMNQIRNPLV